MSTRSRHVDPLRPEACFTVLERAAASPHLKRAARLKEFLFYVGGKSLKEGCNEIHEQEIGHAVFGRREHYDTSQDNIVRVNATELRKRISAYFTAEGSDEPLIFEIPRGSYTPVFSVRLPEVESAADLKGAESNGNGNHSSARLEDQDASLRPAGMIAGVPASPYRHIPLIATSSLAALLTIACAVLWSQNRSMRLVLHPWQMQPALASFWPRFLDPHTETDIVLADTSYALVEDITRQSPTLSDYLNHSYLDQIQSPSLSDERHADLHLIATRLNGSMGDFNVAQKIQALDPGSKTVFMEYARDYSADSLKRNNVILIGSQKGNPWVYLFSDRMNFHIQYDAALDQSFIQNLNPKPGEQAMYAAPRSAFSSLGYSIIAYLPNPSRTANALLIAGTDSQAGNAAGEFMTSESSLEGLLKTFHTSQIPYFEVLLKTTRLSGTPFKAEIIAYRTY